MCIFGRKRLLKQQEDLEKQIHELILLNTSLRENITQTMGYYSQNIINGFGVPMQLVTNSVNGMSDRVEQYLGAIRVDNEKQLNAMREVVEQKLQSALHTQLNGTVANINQRLDAVNKSLGELQNLSSGMTDLKKVLGNVKSRGTWGEISLHHILEGILTKEQYVCQCNVGDKRRGDGSDVVDFAIVLPGKGENDCVYLPIDSKFPTEDYQRIVDASEKGDAQGVEIAAKAFCAAVKKQAKSISEKYITARTTDFAVMYLPTEGLYAEVLRSSGLVEELQNVYKVVPAGPTTVTALINSLQLGFRTLAVQKSSREVFSLLAKFKKDFNTYVEDIEKAQAQLQAVGQTLDRAGNRNRQILKKLGKVEGLAVEGADDESDE